MFYFGASRDQNAVKTVIYEVENDVDVESQRKSGIFFVSSSPTGTDSHFSCCWLPVEEVQVTVSPSRTRTHIKSVLTLISNFFHDLPATGLASLPWRLTKSITAVLV